VNNSGTSSFWTYSDGLVIEKVFIYYKLVVAYGRKKFSPRISCKMSDAVNFVLVNEIS